MSRFARDSGWVIAAGFSASGCHERALSSPPAVAASAAPSAVAPKSPCPADMVRFEGGTFPWHGSVSVGAFCLHRSEVTVARYAACVRSGACSEPDRGGACNYGAPGREGHPVNCIDHAQAAAFCGSLEGRLPNDAEWRWAARGAGAGTTYPWGSAEPDAQVCWSGKRLRHETCPVDSFPAGDSPESVHDVVGNVEEWLATRVPPRDGDGFEIGGGSFMAVSAVALASSTRSYAVSDIRSERIGVRCAADIGHAAQMPDPVPVPGSSPATVSDPSPSPTPAGPCGAAMVLIAGGSYIREGQGRPVVVPSLCFGSTEVTVREYASCVAAGRCPVPDGGGACNWAVPGRERHPINCLSASEAESYCAWIHARLPSEVEWEWAARGGKAGTVFPWGSADAGAQLCWSGVTKRRETCPVGAFPAGRSPDGASDLAGNVAEWTSTDFRNPSIRVVRGGSFSATDPKAVGWRVFEYQKTDRRDEGVGVRCVAASPR